MTFISSCACHYLNQNESLNLRSHAVAHLCKALRCRHSHAQEVQLCKLSKHLRQSGRTSSR